MLNNIPEDFFLKRSNLKVTVVGVRFDDSCIFPVIFVKQSP